jgi:hypothetical protein
LKRPEQWELRTSAKRACNDEACHKPQDGCDKSDMYYESDQFNGDKRRCRHNHGDDEFQSAHETYLLRRALTDTPPEIGAFLERSTPGESRAHAIK